MEPFAVYLRDIARTPLLPDVQEKALFAALKDRAVPDGPAVRERRRRRAEARDHLIRANLRLVVDIARHFRGRGLAMEDLIAEGNLGLLHGIDKFDLRKGCRLSTYASWWIRQRIRRACETQGRMVCVPNHVLRLMVDWEEARLNLEGESGQVPGAAQIAESLGMEPRTVVSVQNGLRSGRLITGGDRSDEPTASEAIAGRVPVEELEPDIRAALAAALLSLREREQMVLRLRFGLDGPPMTLGEIGERLGLCKERIRQIERDALGQLRGRLIREHVCEDA
jgi:RNA polymerase primary sigma factor